MQEVVQVALHREGLKQELLVVLLAWRVTHEHTPGNTAFADQPSAQITDKLCVV